VLERERAAHQVHLCVVEAREHRRTVRIEDHGLGASQPLDLSIRTDPEDLVATDGHGFLKRGTSARIDLAVDDDEIDRAAGIVALGTDDEAGNEGRSDDDGHEYRGQARRHLLL